MKHASAIWGFLLLIALGASAGAESNSGASPAQTDGSGPVCRGERFVDVADIIPDAVIDMRYAGTNNFLERKFYRANRCLLRFSVAGQLSKAADDLRRQGFRLILWDCYRPQAVQYEMWKAHPVPGEVANPKTGSHHNRGAAVDASLADLQGQPVSMPTDFDAFEPRAWSAAKDVPEPARQNREFLKTAMRKAGFRGIRKEWWHFSIANARRYPLCDQHIDEMAAALATDANSTGNRKDRVDANPKAR